MNNLFADEQPKKPRRLSYAEIGLMTLALKENYVQLPDGRHEYIKGWSDARIAEDLSCAPSVVRAQRIAMFGGDETPADLAALRRELLDLRRRVEQLEVRA